MNPFDPGYYTSDQLRQFGFARVGVELGDYASLSHAVRLLSATDDYSGDRMTNSTLPDSVLGVTTALIRVGQHGTGALLLPGTDIGEGAVVHALSVVSGALSSWTIYAVNPAISVKARSRHLLDHAARLSDGD